jgi:hypothetical protein
VGLIVVSLLTLGIAGTQAAGAATEHAKGTNKVVHVKDIVNAQSTIASLNQTTVFPPGKFVGAVSIQTSKMTGNQTLPDATTPVDIAGVGLANVTVRVVPTTEVVGKFNFNNNHVRATSVFNIDIVSITPVLLGAPNLVGNSCSTSTPISLVFNGTVAPFGGGKVYGTFTIPKFKKCQGLTVALNKLMSGPGNQFSAQMTPII